jgi:glycosyltransferase involved in cell wall biosynthesis
MRVGIDARLDATGIGRYVTHLVQGLAAVDTTTEFVLFLRAERYAAELELGANVEKRLADIRWYSLAEQVRFPALIRSAGVDLVHFPHFNVPLAYRGPYVVTIHDLTHELRRKLPGSAPDPARSRAKSLAYKLVLRKAVSRARQIIAVSETTKRAIVETLAVAPEQITVTHEGVDTDLFDAPDPGALARLGVRSPYFLYVGSAFPHKNLGRLLEAFARAGDGHQLVLAGDHGAYRSELVARALELGVGDRVVLTGAISDAELAALYRGATALVLVSLAEGFGLPGLEAMGLGVPVLASGIDSLVEIYGDAALFVDPADIAAIAGGLRELASDAGARSRLVELGTARVAQFSWRAMAEQTRQVYAAALRSGPAR